MNDQANPALIKLDKKEWKDSILDYIAARYRKTQADAESRAAKGVIRTIQSRLYAAMNGASVALCGNAVLTAKTTAGAHASLTLADGSKLAWDKVTSILVGNQTIPTKDVISIYGGRSASDEIDVSGVP